MPMWLAMISIVSDLSLLGFTLACQDTTPSVRDRIDVVGTGGNWRIACVDFLTGLVPQRLDPTEADYSGRVKFSDAAPSTVTLFVR